MAPLLRQPRPGGADTGWRARLAQDPAVRRAPDVWGDAGATRAQREWAARVLLFNMALAAAFEGVGTATGAVAGKRIRGQLDADVAPEPSLTRRPGGTQEVEWVNYGADEEWYPRRLMPTGAEEAAEAPRLLPAGEPASLAGQPERLLLVSRPTSSTGSTYKRLGRVPDEVYDALRETPAGAKMLKLAEEHGLSPLEWAELPEGVYGVGDPWENIYLLSSKYKGVRPELLAPSAAHEIQHGEPWDPVVMESLTREFGLEHLLTEAPLSSEARPTPTGRLLFGPTDTGRLLLELRSYRTELEVWEAIRPHIEVTKLSGPEIDLVVSTTFWG